MKRLMMALAPAALLAVAGSGCGTFQTVEDAQLQQQRIAGLETSVKSLQENNQQLQAQMEELKQDVKQVETAAASKEQVREVLNEVAEMDKRFAKSDRASQERIATLNSALEKESKIRTEAIKTTIANVGETIAKNNEQIQEQQKKILKALNAAAATPSTQGDYTVQKGDSLAMVAQAFGVSVSGIVRANNLKSQTLRVGQRLVIPAAAGSSKKGKK